MRNIQNHINAVGADNLDLKVVMHGKGLTLLLTPDAIESTKLIHGNADDDMQARISAKDIVPSGVAGLARLQAMGYACIRP